MLEEKLKMVVTKISKKTMLSRWILITRVLTKTKRQIGSSSDFKKISIYNKLYSIKFIDFHPH